MKVRTIGTIASIALLTTACAGPRDSVEIGSKDIAVDIVLGDQRPTPPPLPPGSGPVGGFPGFIGPPVPRPEPGAPPPPPPPPEACPIADPNGASKLVALKRAPRPPVPATYRFRNEGAFTLGEGVEITYPPEQTRTVENVTVTSGGYDFDVAATLAGITTTTTYRVINDSPLPDRGIYLIQIVTRFPNGDAEAFTPDRGLLLMPFPPPEFGTNLEDEIDRQRGADYRSTGTDPISQTTMVLHARIVGKDRANACGEWVDAYDIEVEEGKIVGPTKNIDFTGHYLIAPQYGALVVRDDLTFTGTEDFELFESSNVATINAVPLEPTS